MYLQPESQPWTPDSCISWPIYSIFHFNILDVGSYDLQSAPQAVFLTSVTGKTILDVQSFKMYLQSDHFSSPCLIEIAIIFCFYYWNRFYNRLPCFCPWPVSIISLQDCSEQFVKMKVRTPPFFCLNTLPWFPHDVACVPLHPHLLLPVPLSLHSSHPTFLTAPRLRQALSAFRVFAHAFPVFLRHVTSSSTFFKLFLKRTFSVKTFLDTWFQLSVWPSLHHLLFSYLNFSCEHFI